MVTIHLMGIRAKIAELSRDTLNNRVPLKGVNIGRERAVVIGSGTN